MMNSLSLPGQTLTNRRNRLISRPKPGTITVIIASSTGHQIPQLIGTMKQRSEVADVIVVGMQRPNYLSLICSLFEVPYISGEHIEDLAQLMQTETVRVVKDTERIQLNDFFSSSNVKNREQAIDYLSKLFKQPKSKVHYRSSLMKVSLKRVYPSLRFAALTACTIVIGYATLTWMSFRSAPMLESTNLSIAVLPTAITPTSTEQSIRVLGTVMVITPTPSPKPDPVYEYVVDKGESYWSIALSAVKDYQQYTGKTLDVRNQRRVANQLITMTERVALYPGQIVRFDPATVNEAVYLVLPNIASINP